jgi:hypothetical protein
MTGSTFTKRRTDLYREAGTLYPRAPDNELIKILAGVTSRFFQDIVIPMSLPRHTEKFLDFFELSSVFQKHGWMEHDCGFLSCPWKFSTRDAARDYVLKLFGLSLNESQDRLLDRTLDAMVYEAESGVELSLGLSCLVMRYDP